MSARIHRVASGCGGPDPLPECDTTKPAEEQGLFRKFDVRRTDGSDAPGGKHEGCEYFVLDVRCDPFAKAALAAYAYACRGTHLALAEDLRARYALPQGDLTEAQIRRAARALSDAAAEACNVDPDDEWKVYSETYIEDATRALRAAQL